MRLRPGVHAIALAIGACLLAFTGFIDLRLLWLIVLPIGAGIVLAARDVVFLKKAFPALSWQRVLPSRVGREDPFEVRWVLRSSLPRTVRGEFRELPPVAARPRLVTRRFVLPAGGEVIAEETFVIPTRGQHAFGPLWIRLEGRGRVVEAATSVGEPGSLKVLPETYASADRFQKESGADIHLLDKQIFSRETGEGTEFESLMEYRQGDDPRRIDWRATARMRRPIVRHFQVERHRDVMILIDCGRLMGSMTPRGTKLDCAIDSALFLGRVALYGGDRCGFGLFDAVVRGYLPPVSGIASLSALAECVYDAQVDWGESDFAPMFATMQFRQMKRSLVVVLSDLMDEQTSEPFRTSLARLARRHVVLFAALRTPLLGHLLAEPIDSLLDGSRTAVTFRLLREREEALQSLRHAGVNVLDVEPQHLTAPLINRFVDLRRRNLL